MPKTKLAPRRTPAPNPAQSPPRRKFKWVPILAIAIVLLVGAGVWADWYYGLPEDAHASFVGRESCIQCHQAEHKQWQGSHHDLAMDRATDQTVLGDFNDAELTHLGVTSRMFKKDGKFFVNTEGPDGKLADFEVKYVFGVDPLQQYMVEFDRPPDMPENEIARLQVLRISWDTHKKRWFHLDPPDVQEKLDPSDDLHWTGVAQRWNNMCADCHSTNLKKNFDVATKTYHTTFSEIDVSCEACHGPGSLHVKLAQSKSLFWDRNRGYALASLKGPKNQINEIQACAPCHSRRRVVTGGYTAGCNYYDYFANELLPASIYRADGQIEDEVYEYGSFLQSKMYHKGIRCSDCHNPHSGKLMFEGNKACTSCHQHPAGKYDGFNHHRHPEGSRGASCVECHMPETTYMAVDPRRDHSLRVPRPDLSVKYNTSNACTGCHVRDKALPGATARSKTEDLKKLFDRQDLQEYAGWLRAAEQGDQAVKSRLAEVDLWADEQLTKWYGPNRKRDPHYAEALHAARNMLPEAPKKLVDLLKNKTFPAIARATAALELGAYAEPNSDVTQALRDVLSDNDPQVRAAAVASLQSASNDELFTSLVPLLKDPRRLVRTEAARVLSRFPETDFRGENRQALKRAIDECIAGAAVDNDRAAGHLMLGILYENLNEFQKAEEAYRTAMRVEPSAMGPRTNLASLYDRQLEEAQQRIQSLAQSGNQAAAMEQIELISRLQGEANHLRQEELGLLERDARLAPDNAAVQGRIGLSRYTQNWRKEAEHALLMAHLLDRQNPEYAFNLAIYYRDTGRPEDALPLVEQLQKIRPGSPLFEQLEVEVRQQMQAGPSQ